MEEDIELNFEHIEIQKNILITLWIQTKIDADIEGNWIGVSGVQEKKFDLERKSGEKSAALRIVVETIDIDEINSWMYEEEIFLALLLIHYCNSPI